MLLRAGIWPDSADGTDVNTVACSSSRNLVATGDDSGRVTLFRFPCNQPKVLLMFLHYTLSRFSTSFTSKLNGSRDKRKMLACTVPGQFIRGSQQSRDECDLHPRRPPRALRRRQRRNYHAVASYRLSGREVKVMHGDHSDLAYAMQGN